MKKFTYIMVIALAMTTLISTAALAGGKDCGACPSKSSCAEAAKVSVKSASAVKAPSDCCLEAATKGKGCCGKDAKAVAAKVANYNACKVALTDMHECCAEAVVAGKGCCGKDATALKAEYTKQVSTCATVLGSMDSCCADALANAKGCCGKDAAALKASVSGACNAHKESAKSVGKKAIGSLKKG